MINTVLDDHMTMTVNGKELSEMADVAASTVTTWGQDDGCPCERVGQEQVYVLSKVVRWLVRRTDPKPGTHKHRLIKVQLDTAELNLARKRGLLLPAADVEQLLHALQSELSPLLDAISGRLANEFMGTDPAVVKQKIRAETNRARNLFADAFERLASQYEAGAADLPVSRK